MRPDAKDAIFFLLMSNRKETGTQGVASQGRGIGAGFFPEEQHQESGIAVSLQMAQRPEAIQLHPVVGRHEGLCYHSHPCH